jgi:hypothetical protein
MQLGTRRAARKGTEQMVCLAKRYEAETQFVLETLWRSGNCGSDH